MKSFMMMAVLALSISLTACDKGARFDSCINATHSKWSGGSCDDEKRAPETPVDTVQQDIDALIAQKNADRAMSAQAPLTPGLSCVVQEVSGGQCLATSGCTTITLKGTAYTYLYKGQFNQPDSSGGTENGLLPPALRPLFVNKNYRIVCSGQIVVTESNYYDFSLNSDDGSILNINGSRVITNDNNHGMVLKTGAALLYRGVQSFQLMYAQTGGGNFGLILQSGGASIDPRYYYH